jgi:hypothetical protein
VLEIVVGQLRFDKLRPSLRATGWGDLFPVGGVGEEKVAVFAGAGGQHQVIAFAVNRYALLDEFTHPGLVFGDFYGRGTIGGLGMRTMVSSAPGNR